MTSIQQRSLDAMHSADQLHQCVVAAYWLSATGAVTGVDWAGDRMKEAKKHLAKLNEIFADENKVRPAPTPASLDDEIPF